jgi:isopentenyldiphosphate isomerase
VHDRRELHATFIALLQDLVRALDVAKTAERMVRRAGWDDVWHASLRANPFGRRRQVRARRCNRARRDLDVGVENATQQNVSDTFVVFAGPLDPPLLDEDRAESGTRRCGGSLTGVIGLNAAYRDECVGDRFFT